MTQYRCPICKTDFDLPIPSTTNTHVNAIFDEETTNHIFVAMWFDPGLDPVYDKVITKAIECAGYRPIRIDRDSNYTDLIDHQITDQIRRSKCMIADLTHGTDGVRGSVAYEIGYAHASGIPVIVTCHHMRTNAIPFDINHYPYLIWDENDAAEYGHKLIHAIIKTVGPGPTFFDR